MSSVSEITQHLEKKIKANPKLQNVWMQGEISNIRPIQNGHLNFTLKDNNEKIDCVIFDDGTSLQTDLPSEGSGVYVKGQIFIYGASGEYRFKVTDIKLSENPLPDQSVSVTALTKVLGNTIANPSFEAQGQILDIYEADTGWVNFKIKNATTDEIPNDIIECSLPPSIANNLAFPLTEGEEVNVKGNFKIFSARNTYQIIINNPADIVRVPEVLADPPITRCNQCNQSHDTNYELCPMCHYAQLEHEGIVVGSVMRYFEKFTNFSTQREYSIRLIGTIKGRADVVLLNSQGNLAAIAECKRIGYDGNEGIEQLKSYLFPSESKLGLFADDTDPNKWTFLENLGRRNFDQITRTKFEALIDQEIPSSNKQSNQSPTSSTVPKNSASRFWQYIIVVLVVALCICLTVLIMQLGEKNRQILENTRTISKLQNNNTRLTEKNTQIQDNTKAISQLRNKIATLANEKQALQEQITEKDKQLEEYTSKNSKLENKITNLQKQLLEKDQQSPQNPGVNSPSEPKPPLPETIPKRLNINTATAKELDDLPVPGIGEALSKRIIQYRKQNGNFATVDEITKVPGIGEKTLEKLRGFICVE
jgi:competence ComEA-like helix-hairpin-helix protein